MQAPKPPNEAERLAALARYEILDASPEEEFEEITRLAARMCNAPIALISLVDHARQWFLSEVGLGVTETPLSMSMCAHAILEPDVLVIPDTRADSRFSDNPLVTGDPHVRFYAGALLETDDGHALGTL
ncbi:MAG: diguanylate cyclase [Capsulimonas sp.]|nr:diguanylate cyclase [Capsulimonas sp.]